MIWRPLLLMPWSASTSSKEALRNLLRKAGAVVFDGLQGANRSNSGSYCEDLQRRRPQKSTDASGAGGFSEVPRAADVPQKQAEAQAQALRGVLDAALLEQARQQAEVHARALESLDTKTERAIAESGIKTERSITELKGEIALVRKDMEALENRLVTRLTKAMIAVMGITVGVIGCIAGVARLLFY